MTTPEHHEHVAATAPAGPRNLVICCDGTGNVLGNYHDTNVVKLARLCANDARQLVFYDPGVGTASDLPSVDVRDWISAKLSMLSGLLFGRGIYENVSQAYEFLVHNYRAGDRIFLFGFSRGAFTVRCVAGLLNTYGIVRPCAMPLLPLMLRNYFAPIDEAADEALAQPHSRKTRSGFADDVRRHFTDAVGREAEVHFIGVWDTVASVGGLRSMSMSTQPVLQGRRYRHVRHAVSEGEYRAKYEPRLYEGKELDEPRGEGRDRQPSFKQVWFPGVHSDVGGSYQQAGLSDGALAWMLDELKALPPGEQLHLSSEPELQPKPNAEGCAHDQALESPLWALTGLERRILPEHAKLSPSLQHRRASGKNPLDPALRAGYWRFLLGSVAAMLASYALVWLDTTAIGPERISVARLACLQLRAAWLPEALRVGHAQGIGSALWADTLFVLAYTCFACSCVVYAIRALRSWKPGSKTAHARLRIVSMLGLLGAAGGDLLEDFFSYFYFTQAPLTWHGLPLLGAHSVIAGLLSLSSAAKWLGLLTLLGLCLFAGGWQARAPRERDRISRPALT